MGELTARQRMILEREAARIRSEAGIELLRDGYPDDVNANRDAFVTREAEKSSKEIEKNFLDAIPEADRRDQRHR